MTKEQQNQYYFEMFRQHCALPSGIVEFGDKPDVILNGSRKIGIEITNFYLENGGLPHSEQRQRLKRDAVVLKAQQIYLQKGNKQKRLVLSFDKTKPIKDQERASRTIAAIAERFELDRSGEIARDFYNELPELLFVWLDVSGQPPFEWEVMQVHSTPQMTMANLREIVVAKEAKVTNYRRCDAYWLLVVVDFWDRAQDQEIQIANLEGIQSRFFERIIVYKTVFGQVLDVN